VLSYLLTRYALFREGGSTAAELLLLAPGACRSSMAMSPRPFGPTGSDPLQGTVQI
jgi:alpha-amylase